MAERTFEYRDEDYNVRITLRRASVRQGIKRSALINEALVAREKAREAGEIPKEFTPALLQEQLLRIHTYPACLGALVKVENLAVEDSEGKKSPPKLSLSEDLTFEEFLDLPDGLVILWEDGAYRLNPHWVPRPPEEDNEEGKGRGRNAKSAESDSTD